MALQTVIFDSKNQSSSWFQSGNIELIQLFEYLDTIKPIPFFSYSNPNQSILRINAPKNFSQTLREIDPEIIFSMDSLEPFFIKNNQLPIHVLMISGQDEQILESLRAFKYKYFIDAFIFHSTELMETLISQWGIHPNKCYNLKQPTNFSNDIKNILPISSNKEIYFLKQARRNFQEKKYEEALESLKKIDCAEKNIISGFCYLKLQQWIEASNSFKEGIDNNDFSADGLFGLALVYLITGNLKQGALYLMKAKQKQPLHAEVNVALKSIRKKIQNDPQLREIEEPTDTSHFADPEFLFTVM